MANKEVLSKLQCYTCGRKITDRFFIVSEHEGMSDRVFLMCDAPCVNKTDNYTYFLEVRKNDRRL